MHTSQQCALQQHRVGSGIQTVVNPSQCGIIHPCARRPENTMAMYNSSYEHIMASARRSLQDLQTEYIDVLLIHRPDLLMDPQEVARAFAELHAQNSVRYFGVSNFSPSQLELLQAALPADIRLVTNQIEVSALHIDPLVDGTLDQCLRLGISPMAWSPFGMQAALRTLV
jgi:predicted oxidoreductase